MDLRLRVAPRHFTTSLRIPKEQLAAVQLLSQAVAIEYKTSILLVVPVVTAKILLTTWLFSCVLAPPFPPRDLSVNTSRTLDTCDKNWHRRLPEVVSTFTFGALDPIQCSLRVLRQHVFFYLFQIQIAEGPITNHI